MHVETVVLLSKGIIDSQKGGKAMRIGAYQFKICGNISNNMANIVEAIQIAADEEIRLLVFPECALTGYPPRDIESSKKLDFAELSKSIEELQSMAKNYDMFLLVGSIIKAGEDYYNSALLFYPDGQMERYDKRALWGWDKDNFSVGNKNGIFVIDGIKIGIRICFEIRFPEYFRELYREATQFNIVLFYDVDDSDNQDRYELIRSHIRTRAVENVTSTMTVDAIYPYQTAPTGVYDKSGRVQKELKRNQCGLLIYDFIDREDDFGEHGRRELSNQTCS